MFVDLAKSTRSELPRCDVAIIGAGAAGITLALELENSGLSVTVLEGGYRDPTILSQDRYKGEVSASEGFSYPALDAWRLRYLGGTTNHWVGWCRRIEENVFGSRSDGLGEGWPFERDELEAGYSRALEICTLGRDVFDAQQLLADRGEKPIVRENQILATPVWRFPKELRFGGFYRTRIQESAISFYLGANCLGFEFDESGSTARASVAHLRNELGVEFTIRAGTFVLACGGIENTRQLLVAAQDVPSIDRSDVLGRGFLEHPHGAVGAILTGDHSAEELASLTDFPKDIDGTQFKIGIGLDEKYSAEHGLVNTSFTMEPLGSLPREALHGAAVKKLWAVARSKASEESPSRVMGLYARSEQRWNSESRISLTSTKDDMGSNRARLDWRVGAADVADLRTSLELVGGELMKIGFGPLTCGDPAEFSTMEGGGHHLGGARMSERNDRGVVDRNLRCHAVDNLYAVGGSAFPSAGFSNPTLTIVALAVRLAQTLKENLS